MAYPVPTIEPATIIAGDLVTWKRSLSDYPASTWTLTYELRSDTDGEEITITATADGNDHLVSEAAATTAGWTVATYYWTAIVTSGTSRHVICTGSLKVKSDPQVVTTSDDRTDAKIILDALIALMKTRSTRSESAYSLQAAGRSFTFHNHRELREEIQYWQSVVRTEEQQARADKGLQPGNRILARL